MRKNPIHEHWVKHQIQYTSLEEVGKFFITNNFLLHALKSWNCLSFIRKRKLIFSCLIKLLFIKVRRLTNVKVSLEANLEGQKW